MDDKAGDGADRRLADRVLGISYSRRCLKKSKNSKQLVRRIGELVECSERLRELLRHYEKANLDFAKFIDSGQPAINALGKVKTPIRRKELTEAMEEFDETRHQVRLALFAQSVEEGTSRSRVGQAIGISRQLASRLALELEGAGS